VPLNFDKGRNQRDEVCDEGVGLAGRESGVQLFCQKSLIRYLMTGDGIVANRGLIEMLESLFALADYRPSLSTLTFEGGDLHWRLLH